MGRINKVLPVKLISGIITGDINNFAAAEKILSRKFGSIDYKSPIYDFDQTDYYEKEMGPALKRRFVSFSRLIDPVRLPSIKLYANKIEKRFSKNNKRRVNIDPGYIAASKLILASTKDFSHRIYLRGGVYAEVTLYYKDRDFRALDWTYPDFKTAQYIETFNHIRNIYMGQL